MRSAAGGGRGAPRGREAGAGTGSSDGAARGARRLGRSPWATGLAMLALTSGVALLGACPGSSFTIEGGDPGGGGGGDCAASPSDNASVLSDNCGVFVSPTGSDDMGAGTRASPYKTLAKAIDAASTTGAPRVYACAGPYGESVVIPGGVELFGSLDCEAGTWAPGMAKSVITGVADMVAVRLLDGGPTVIEGFRIEAANAAAAGGSSIAVLAEPMAKVEIRGSELVAGDGAEGQKGMDGNQNPPMTMPTGEPNKGIAACMTMMTNPGGIEHPNNCGGTDASIGGPGGAGFVNQAGPGADGIASPAPMTPAGAGGVAGADCGAGGDGMPGTAGADGQPGAAAQGSGALSVSGGYVGVSGGAGTKGTPGQGGGGGAGQKGSAFACPGGTSGAGASGGSGGAGGCGGEGGGGGGPGGSSIALVSISATVTLSSVILQAGKGGRGGAGGDAQVGGLGVPGAMGGGNNGNVALKIGCMGGDGGPGGDGGQGAGGNGGHSLGMAHFGEAPTGSFEATAGVAGAGGLGGSSGYPGEAGESLVFDALDPG